MRNKSSIVIVIAAMVGWSLATSAPAAVITSFTYAYNANGYLPHASYPDSGGTELNDNAGLTAAYSDAGWVGILNNPLKTGSQAQPRLDITFDQVYGFQTLAVTYLRDIGSGGIYTPDRVELRFSETGFSYSDPMVSYAFIDSLPDTSVKTATFNLAGNSGQYIMAEFFAGNGGVVNTFTFLGELDFTGTVPEPASLGVAMVSAVMLCRRRR